MWFLWLQILFLLLLAAACGAGLAYWWLRGRFEDVSESYSALISSGETNPDFLLRKHVDARFADLSAKIDRIENTDVSPLEQKLLSLENTLAPQDPDLEPVLREIRDLGGVVERSGGDFVAFDDRLSAIEAGLSQLPNTSQQIEALDAKIERQDDVDLSPLHKRLEAIEAGLSKLSALDSRFDNMDQQSTALEAKIWAPLKADISRLDGKIGQLKNANLDPVQQDIQSVRDRLPTLAEAIDRIGGRLNTLEQHFVPINERLNELSSKTVISANNHNALLGLDQKLNGFEAFIAAIKQRMDQIGGLVTSLEQRSDTTSLSAKLDDNRAAIAALRPALSAVETIEPLEKNLAHLREMVFNLRERDLSTINASIRSIEGRVDFVGVENRLTSIEYGLAATHHMLRSRLEQNADLTPPPQRDPFRSAPTDSAFAIPSQVRKPEAALDPVDILRTDNAPGNLLVEPGFGVADNLEKIRGIGPMLRQLLNDIGVFYYWQVAGWTEEDVAFVDEKLPGYHGRITRDRWVEQAAALAQLSGSARKPQPFGEEM